MLFIFRLLLPWNLYLVGVKFSLDGIAIDDEGAVNSKIKKGAAIS